jgi:DNA (cytosine-5)-methyltransferase 1
MLQLAKGQAMEVIVDTFEKLGYRWAYRVVDSRCGGVPQRRKRVYFLASLHEDPRRVLFADESGEPAERMNAKGVACGFYWTEGVRGLGWAVDAVPTLKGGSTVGIPSSPAILLPSGDVMKPDIRDAERLQGFPANWTKPAEGAGRGSFRWKLVGNAVTVPVAAWIGKRLAVPAEVLQFETRPLLKGASWPSAAWNVGEGRVGVKASEWPIRRPTQPLTKFLKYPLGPLSAKATAGFLSRASTSSLRFPEGFIDAVEAHLRRVGGDQFCVPARQSKAQRAFAF